jgi:hypothetical protein
MYAELIRLNKKAVKFVHLELSEMILIAVMMP